MKLKTWNFLATAPYPNHILIVIPPKSTHSHLAFMLEEDLDNSFNEEDLHCGNTSNILDDLDQMGVDGDPQGRP
jgi:hypothetical protein